MAAHADVVMQVPGAPLHAQALEPPSLPASSAASARSIATALPSCGALLLPPQLAHKTTSSTAERLSIPAMVLPSRRRYCSTR